MESAWKTVGCVNLVHSNQHHERISLARRVPLRLQEIVDQFRCVRNQVLVVAVDGEHTQHSITSDVSGNA